MQAIVTKFYGPTNFRGARVMARCQAKRISVAWDHALGVEENHMAAARTLAEELGWAGLWYGGDMPDGMGNVYVCAGANFAPHLYAGESFRVTKKEGK